VFKTQKETNMEKRFTRFSFGTMKLSKLDSKLHYNVKIECDNQGLLNKIMDIFKNSGSLYFLNENGVTLKVLPGAYERILKIYDKFNAVYEICAKDNDILVLSSDKNLYSVLDKNWNTEKTKDGILKIPFVNKDGVANNFKNVHTEIKFYFIGKKEATQKQIPVEDFKVIEVGRYIAVIGSDSILSAAENCFGSTVKLNGTIMIPFGLEPELVIPPSSRKN
jgi:hypothetical protein